MPDASCCAEGPILMGGAKLTVRSNGAEVNSIFFVQLRKIPVMHFAGTNLVKQSMRDCGSAMDRQPFSHAARFAREI
jgi:hypothetical protein